MEQKAPSGMKFLRNSGVFGFALLVAILVVLPLFGLGPNAVRLLFVTFVWITVSIAWNVLGGFGGQVSFGFAVFYGLGAYAAALAVNSGLHTVPALLLAAGVAVVASLVIGLPTFRLRGPYFASATIGVSEAVRVVMTNVSLTGGASGYRILETGPFRQLDHFYISLALAVLALAASVQVRRSRFGLALMAIREDEDAASDLGVDPFRTSPGCVRVQYWCGHSAHADYWRSGHNLGTGDWRRRLWIDP